MYFLESKKAKVVFGWSAKCGCTHIKRLFKYLEGDVSYKNANVHTGNTYGTLPSHIGDDVTIIIITRNPYERLVSGFFDKYKKGCSDPWKHRSRWNKKYNNQPPTFAKFVEELIHHSSRTWDKQKNDLVIDKHHFTPQTSEAFQSQRLEQHPYLIVYDLPHIDYAFIESLYNTSIPESVLNDHGNHINSNTQVFEKPVFNMSLDDYVQFKVPYSCFYNEELRDKVASFYKNDFEFMEKHGINHVLLTLNHNF